MYGREAGDDNVGKQTDPPEPDWLLPAFESTPGAVALRDASPTACTGAADPVGFKWSMQRGNPLMGPYSAQTRRSMLLNALAVRTGPSR